MRALRFLALDPPGAEISQAGLGDALLPALPIHGGENFSGRWMGDFVMSFAKKSS